MPQENNYKIPRQARADDKPLPALPESDKKTLSPEYLLGHQNHFDPNVYTPDDMIKRGVLQGKKSSLTRT